MGFRCLSKRAELRGETVGETQPEGEPGSGTTPEGEADRTCNKKHARRTECTPRRACHASTLKVTHLGLRYAG